MDLKDKLARLGSAPPGGADRDGVLSGLRERMAEIIGREPAAPVRVEPSSADLGFLREEREDGTIYRSFRRLLPSHHVGRLPVDAARVADAELISLLALDARLLGCRFERALFLDTETTGLGGGAGVLAFLVGLSFFDEDGHACLEQLLLRRPVDEPALLRWVAERVAAADLVITYNGKSFDLPLLASRMVMNRMPPLPERPHLDLLHVARRLHQRRLGACRLTTLEGAVLGFERGPDVAGSEMAARYAHFLRTGEEAALSGVVEHNAWDVLSMMALVGLYGEPLDLLVSQDLVGLSRTLRRARALDRAHQAAEAAVARGGGGGGGRARAPRSRRDSQGAGRARARACRFRDSARGRGRGLDPAGAGQALRASRQGAPQGPGASRPRHRGGGGGDRATPRAPGAQSRAEPALSPLPPVGGVG